MPEKQKTNNWNIPKTIIAGASLATAITMLNTFASHDRQGAQNSAALTPTAPAEPQTKQQNACPPAALIKNLGRKCVTGTVTRTRSS